MDSLFGIKTQNEDFEVEYEILSPIDRNQAFDPQHKVIVMALQTVDGQLEKCEQEIAKLNAEIDRLTNHADGLDYTVAVASGVLTGLLDSFFGEEIKKAVDKSVNNVVIDSAKNEKIKDSIKKAEAQAKEKGQKLSKEARESIKQSVENQFKVKSSASGVVTEEEQKRVLSKAIRYLENHKKSPTDSVWNYKGSTITPESHHIDDLSHHPSIVGLVASILTQFSGHGYFGDHKGAYLPISIGSDINPNSFVQKIVHGFTSWFGHLMSDIAGTSGKNAGSGMGIPGPILSLAKEISMIPGLNKTNLSEIVDEMFVEMGFDFRMEMAQSIPVILNDIFVRVFYSIRRFVTEYKEKKNFKEIDWKKVKPFGNRTITRMLTIATGTFTAIDIADAAVRAGVDALKSRGDSAVFLRSFVLKVNFVGVGRFAIAVGTDVKMGVQRNKLRDERMSVMGKELTLLNAKVYYKCAEIHCMEEDMFESQAIMWLEAEGAVQTLMEASEIAKESIQFCQQSLNEIYTNLEKISQYVDSIEQYNQGLTKDLTNILKWGQK